MSKASGPISKRPIPGGFLRLSDAINRLAKGMWAGLPRAKPVQRLKLKYLKLSVEFGPQRKRAAEGFMAAVLNEKLAIYVIGPLGIKIRMLPRSVLQRLITFREVFPDHPIRPTIKTAGGDRTMLALLTEGQLAVRGDEFNAWYRSERAKGKWPSQRPRAKRGPGRPTKTKHLREGVLTLVRDQKWSSRDGVAKLHRILVDSGHSGVPSVDTLERFIAQLYVETGNPALYRKPRTRRKRADASAAALNLP